MPVPSTRRSVLHRSWHRLVDFLLPAACPLCSSACGGDPFCHACLSGIKPPLRYACPTCGEPYSETCGSHHPCQACMNRPPAHRHYFTAGLYEGPLREAIHRFKYEGRVVLDRALARLVDAALPAGLEVDQIVPVPLYPDRLRSRGYNQAKLIAAQLSRLRRWPLSTSGLDRIRQTEPQQGLAARHRRTNLKNAFGASESIAGSRLLLIDDVCTTGATLAACSDALSKAGAAEIIAVTVARARRHGPLPLEEK